MLAPRTAAAVDGPPLPSDGLMLAPRTTVAGNGFGLLMVYVSVTSWPGAAVDGEDETRLSVVGVNVAVTNK